MRMRRIASAVVFSLLAALSPLSADPAVQRGIDAFVTAGNGKTYVDFSYNPLPAGFFCRGSKAFTDRVAFKGLPLVTEPPGGLWNADTVVERLDDAVFDERGAATTRVRFRALSLVSVAPVETACGAFHAYVSLAGKQRVTKMSLARMDKNGGSFSGPLAVDADITFVPVGRGAAKEGRKLVIRDSITFPGVPMPWRLTAGAKSQPRIAAVTVDTDGDLIPDTRLPGTSNFSVGAASGSFLDKAGTPCSCCPGELCHADDGRQHCFTVTMCPGTYSCC